MALFRHKRCTSHQDDSGERCCSLLHKLISSAATHGVCPPVGADDLGQIPHCQIPRTQVAHECKAMGIGEITSRNHVSLETGCDRRSKIDVCHSRCDGAGC